MMQAHSIDAQQTETVQSVGWIAGEAGLEAIVESHGQAVDSMARRICASLPEFASIELNDLVQAGNVGLVNAVHSYSPESGVPFEIYARYRIRGEMIDTLRRLDAASRNLRAWQKKIRQTEIELATELNRQPSEQEVCGRLGLEVDRLRRKNMDIRAAYAVTRCTDRGERLEEEGRNQAGPDECRPDAVQSELERQKIVTFAVNQLPDRPRQVIRLYYLEEYTMREIGEILQVDESRVSQIHKIALRRIAENLKHSGITSPTHL